MQNFFSPVTQLRSSEMRTFSLVLDLGEPCIFGGVEPPKMRVSAKLRFTLTRAIFRASNPKNRAGAVTPVKTGRS